MKIGIIGAGNMSEAMLAAWLEHDLTAPTDVLLADVRQERLDELHARYGVAITCDNTVVSASSDVLLLGVKPQQLDELLAELRGSISDTGLVISIAAGKRLAWFEQRLPHHRIVRVMPNIACRVGEAMSVYSLGSRASAADASIVNSLFSAFGRVLELPEERMDIVTAVSGSGPAFFARMVQAMVRAAEDQGLAPEQAVLLAVQTMRGAAALLLDGDLAPAELIAAVSSARGVTVAGLEVMDRRGFDAVVAETISVAAERSRELAGAASNG